MTLAAATAGALVAGAGGALAWGLVAVVMAGLGLMVLAQHDRLRRVEHEAEAIALRDSLTGLPNRRGFEERAAAAISRARRRNEPFTLLYLDLDDFADVNERLGHAHGDEVLRSVALEAVSVLRGEDVIARMDGDEFAILLPQSTEEAERRLVARVTAAVQRSTPASGPLVRVSATVGSACYPRDGQAIGELLEVAKRSLRQVRASRAAAETIVPPLVPEDSLAECDAQGGDCSDRAAGAWRLRRALLVSGSLLAALAVAWFALPPLAGGEALRPALTAIAMIAAAAACITAAGVAAGRERAGWALVGAGVLLWFVPFAGAVAGAASALGLLFVLSGRWLSDRYRLLDTCGVGLSVTAFTIALLTPPLIAADAPGAALIASRISVAMLGAALTTAAVLTVYWAPIRQRPDALLVALAYLLAVAATSPWSLALESWLFVPSAPWELALAVAGALIVCAALLRSGRSGERTLEGGELEARTLDATVAGNVLLAGVACGILLWGGPIAPTALIALLLAVVLLRDARSRLLERDRRELRESAIRSRRELAIQWRANLASLSRALTARDGYTGAHSAATVDLSKRVARKLGLSRQAVREVEIVAMLHDLGKIGISDELLRAARPLSESEWEQMREHPVIGERILRSVPGLEQVARSVRHEHERWDGKGYPDGLSGTDVPLPSRIVLACDAFHAMASDRPYRPARSRREAMAEIKRGAGTQFDPAVAHALLDVLLEEEQGDRARNGRRSLLRYERRAARAG